MGIYVTEFKKFKIKYEITFTGVSSFSEQELLEISIEEVLNAFQDAVSGTLKTPKNKLKMKVKRVK